MYIPLTATNETDLAAELTVHFNDGSVWMVWKGIDGGWLANWYYTCGNIPTDYLCLCRYRYWQGGAWHEFSPERIRAGKLHEALRKAQKKPDASVAPAPSAG